MKCLLGCISLVCSKWKGEKIAKKKYFADRPTLCFPDWWAETHNLFFRPNHILYTSAALSNQVSIFLRLEPPWGLRGFKVKNISSVSPACRKRRLNGAVCWNHHIKRVVPCWCRTGTLKNPAKCLWHWEPDRRYNFFFSPPAHLCHHIYDWNIVASDVKHQ